MHWYCLPQRLDLPDSFAATGLWYPEGGTVGSLGELVAFRIEGGVPVVVRAANIAPGFVAGGVALARAAGLYAGRAYWAGGSAGVLFHSAARDVWIFDPAGMEPREPVLDRLDDGSLVGDDWYECVGSDFDLSPRSSSASTFAPAGVNAASGSPISVVASWPRWERTNATRTGADISGVYTAAGGETGADLTLGVPTWHENASAAHPGRVWVLVGGVLRTPDGSVELVARDGVYDFSDAPGVLGLYAVPAAGDRPYIQNWQTGQTAGRLLYDGIGIQAETDREPDILAAEVAGWLW